MSRRETTLLGGQCTACEEPLEHTLQGERVLQFPCGHVAHEACFYEFVKESDAQSQCCPTCDAPFLLHSFQSRNLPDLSANRQFTGEFNRSCRKKEPPDRSNRNRLGVGLERLGTSHPSHRRDDSGYASSAYLEQNDPCKHESDRQTKEPSEPNAQLQGHRNPTFPPSVTMRSEFPTLTRSKQQQSLTCVVTIQVPEGRWHIPFEDLQGTPPVPLMPSDPSVASRNRPVFDPQPLVPQEPQAVLEKITEELRIRMDNWHALEFARFGDLRLHGFACAGKDRQSLHELECYLFGELLILVSEKSAQPPVVSASGRKLSRCTLKGTILIKKHLRQVQAVPEQLILTLNLSVPELPTLHLQFHERSQLDIWARDLLYLHAIPAPLRPHLTKEQQPSGTNEEKCTQHTRPVRQAPSVTSSYGGPRSTNTAPAEFSPVRPLSDRRLLPSLHVPLDLVVVIPVSTSMQVLKISLFKDTLRFLLHNLGDRDRMGLVTFGSGDGSFPLVGTMTKSWPGWNTVLNSIQPVGKKSLRADVIEGANVAMDVLMQRKAANPISTILLISDSSTSNTDGVGFVVRRAETAKVGIYSFGLGLTHRPDSMIELSSRTNASYIYVKNWTTLRECAAGVLGSLQSLSHQDVKLKLKLPKGSPTKLMKISGALQTTERANGRDAEFSLGNLRFGDKRDILVQLTIEPDHSQQDQAPQDTWGWNMSEYLGADAKRVQSIVEVPLLRADLSFGDMLRKGNTTRLASPSLLAIMMLPSSQCRKPDCGQPTPPIPRHPSVVQRRMELLTSEMLIRALTLVSSAQHDRAQHLLKETRMTLKGLGKGGLPPLPPRAGRGVNRRHTSSQHKNCSPQTKTPDRTRTRDRHPHSGNSTPIPRPSGIDLATVNALDKDLESTLEGMNHPPYFLTRFTKGGLASYWRHFVPTGIYVQNCLGVDLGQTSNRCQATDGMFTKVGPGAVVIR